VLSPGNKLCKFADDTYLIIPASNVDSRSAEFNNIETWARKNNLTLNRSKSKEIVFIDRKRKRETAPPPEMAGIVRVTSLKILGVTVTNKLSASDHVHDVINNCAKSLYALRVLRARGMCDSALQAIYRSVINAKLLYASSAWWGFTNAKDRHRVDGFQRRSIRCGYCPPDLPTFEEQCSAADQKLFVSIQSNTNHLLYYLLPPPTIASQHYDMRPRTHNRQLPVHSGHLTDSNFITRMLYTNIY